MSYVPDNPLVVQSDHTLLLETLNPRYAEARDALLAFAELVKSPEYVHTWRITPLSLWNAAASGQTAASVTETLQKYAKFPVPPSIPLSIADKMSRYGQLRLVRDGPWLRLESDDPAALAEIRRLKEAEDLFSETADKSAIRVSAVRRGEIKQVLTSLGHPVQDLAGYEDGDPLTMRMRSEGSGGEPLSLRDYQVDAIDAFLSGISGGSGVVVLPCGAGKTLVGIGAMVRLGMRTLVLCTGTTSLRQWRREILQRTTLGEADVGEYTAERKEIASVTLTTYQMLSWREKRGALPRHFARFRDANWGLVVYDEVHLLPAPIFRETAFLQARRKLGLTATLVREDGLEGDVFALVGPKRYDLPWKTLEAQGWIASARCVEVRVALSASDRERYAALSTSERYRLAATNARKGPVVEQLIARHPDAQVLVLGTYLEQLTFVARRLSVPMVSGSTPDAVREKHFAAFRSGTLRVLALSKVGNLAIDLPGASVAIEISGTFGSRQEEAQRLGRVLRPKGLAGGTTDNQATFYTLVTPETREQEYAERRQLFLTEQGYPYHVEHAETWVDTPPESS